MILIDYGIYLDKLKNQFLKHRTEGVIINENFEVLRTFHQVWSDEGEYREEVVEALEEFDLKLTCLPENQTLYNVEPNSKIPKAIREIKELLYQRQVIRDFLTPEKQEELINLFKKKNGPSSEA